MGCDCSIITKAQVTIPDFDDPIVEGVDIVVVICCCSIRRTRGQALRSLFVAPWPAETASLPLRRGQYLTDSVANINS